MLGVRNHWEEGERNLEWRNLRSLAERWNLSRTWNLYEKEIRLRNALNVRFGFQSNPESSGISLEIMMW